MPVEPVTVVVEGVPDAADVRRIEHTVRSVMGQANLVGRWIVAIAPADLRGRWGVGIKGPLVRHVFSFPAPPEKVVDVIGDYLRRAIERMPPVP